MTISVECEPNSVATSTSVNSVKAKVVYNESDLVEQRKCEEIVSQLTEDEITRMPDIMMPRRYLRGEKSNVKSATENLKETLKWRKDFDVDKIVAGGYDELMKVENQTGKMYVRGYDKDGSAVMYMKPGLENTNNEENQMRHLVWVFERAIAATTRNTGGKEEKISVIIDYEKFSAWNSPPMSTTKHTAKIFQNHYPERMKRVYMCNPPSYFSVFWALAKPFIDPVTRDKVVFCNGKAGLERVKELMNDMEKIETCAGGKALQKFDSTTWIESRFDETFDE